jgi:hypothetical protein
MGFAIRMSAVVAVVVLAATGDGLAQDVKKPDGQSPRHGLYLSVGAGGGSVGFECSICNSDNRTGGASGYIGLGGTLSPHWRLGGEVNVWGRSEGGVDRVAVAVQFVAAWYPSRTGGFFVKAGVGGLAHAEDDGTNELTASGGSFSLGIGYDVRIGRSLAITPFLNSIATSKSTVQLNGAKVPGVEVNPNLVQVGLALSLL